MCVRACIHRKRTQRYASNNQRITPTLCVAVYSQGRLGVRHECARKEDVHVRELRVHPLIRHTSSTITHTGRVVCALTNHPVAFHRPVPRFWGHKILCI